MWKKFEIASNGALTTETSLVGAVDGLKVEFKGNDTKGDLSATYFHRLGTFFGEIDALNLAKASASISGGEGALKVGAGADFNLTKNTLGDFSAAVGYSVQNCDIIVKSTKTFAEYSALGSYKASSDLTLAAEANYGTSLKVKCLGLYKCNPDTIVKVKADTKLGLGVSVKQHFEKKLSLTGVVEVPHSFDSAKFGLAINLG